MNENISVKLNSDIANNVLQSYGNNDKLLTIIIPAYNMENYLEQALESCVVHDEVVRNLYEVIVVNDGSSDLTQSIAEEYERKYSDIFSVINKENGGYGSAINIGSRAAEGKYLKILDADDWYDTEALQEFVKRLAVTNCDMVITDFEIINDQTGKRKHMKFELKINTTLALSNAKVVQKALRMHSLCYKTDIFKKNDIQITEHCFYTDTQYILYPLKYVDTVIYYPLNLYQYRVGRQGQSVSLEGIQKHIGDFEKIISDVNVYFKNGIEKNHELVEAYIVNIYVGYIRGILCFPCSRSNKQLIKKWQKEAQDMYPYGYACRENLKLYLLRKSNYLLYRPCSWYAKNIEIKFG